MRCDIEECSSANHGWATVLWALVLVSLAYAGRCMRHRSLASPSQVSLRRHTVMSASLLLVGAGLATSIGAHLAAPTGTCGVVCHEYLFDAHAEEYYGVQSAERPLPSLSFSAGRWPQNWHPTPLVGAQDTLDGACLGSCGVGCGSPLWLPSCFAHDVCVLHYSQALIARNASRLVHGFTRDPICGGLAGLAVVASARALGTVVLCCSWPWALGCSLTVRARQHRAARPVAGARAVRASWAARGLQQGHRRRLSLAEGG